MTLDLKLLPIIELLLLIIQSTFCLYLELNLLNADDRNFHHCRSNQIEISAAVNGLNIQCNIWVICLLDLDELSLTQG